MIDYSFYAGAYGGDLVSDVSFPRYLARAWNILNRKTFDSIKEQDGKFGQIVRGEFREFTSSELLAVQYGLCSLIDTLAKLDTAEAKALAGSEAEGNVKSRSSGGESISYETVKTAYDVALNDEDKKNELYKDALIAYMSPTTFRINPFYAGWG